MSQDPSGQFVREPDPDLNPGGGGNNTVEDFDDIIEMETETFKTPEGRNPKEEDPRKKRPRASSTPEITGKSSRHVSPLNLNIVRNDDGKLSQIVAVTQLGSKSAAFHNGKAELELTMKKSNEEQDTDMYDVGKFMQDTTNALIAETKSSYASVVSAKSPKAKFNHQVIRDGNENEENSVSGEIFQKFHNDMEKKAFEEAINNGIAIQILNFFRANNGHMRILTDDEDSIKWADHYFKETVIEECKLKIIYPEVYKGHKCSILFHNYGDLDFTDFAKLVKIFNKMTGCYVRLVAKIPTKDPERPEWKGLVVNLDVDDDFKEKIVSQDNKVFYGLSSWPAKFPDPERAKAMKRDSEKPKTLGSILISKDNFKQLSKGAIDNYIRKLRVFMNQPGPTRLPFCTLEGAIAAGKDLNATASPNAVKPSKRRKTTKGNSNSEGQKVVIRESKMTTVTDQKAATTTATTTSSPEPMEMTATTSSEVVNADVPQVLDCDAVNKPIDSGEEYRANILRQKQETNRKKKASQTTSKKSKTTSEEGKQRPIKQFMVQKNNK